MQTLPIVTALRLKKSRPLGNVCVCAAVPVFEWLGSLSLETKENN